MVHTDHQVQLAAGQLAGDRLPQDVPDAAGLIIDNFSVYDLECQFSPIQDPGEAAGCTHVIVLPRVIIRQKSRFCACFPDHYRRNTADRIVEYLDFLQDCKRVSDCFAVPLHGPG